MSRVIALIVATVSFSGCVSSAVTIVHDGPALPVQAIAVRYVALNVSEQQPWTHYEKLRDTIRTIERAPLNEFDVHGL